MLDMDDARPYRDKRFLKCVIRTVGTEEERQAAREKRIEIYAAIQRRMAGKTSVARSDDGE